MLNLETELGLQVIEAETAVQKAWAVAASEEDPSSLREHSQKNILRAANFSIFLEAFRN